MKTKICSKCKIEKNINKMTKKSKGYKWIYTCFDCQEIRKQIINSKRKIIKDNKIQKLLKMEEEKWQKYKEEHFLKKYKSISKKFFGKKGKYVYDGNGNRACPRCKSYKPKDDFERNRVNCKNCRQYRRKYRERNKSHFKKYYQKNKQKILEYRQNYLKLRPWMKHLGNIRYRCNNSNDRKYKYYGGKGIKCFLTFKQIKFLWFRDKAYEMNLPCIHRKDGDGNYTVKNCQFKERKEHHNLHKRKIFKI